MTSKMLHMFYPSHHSGFGVKLTAGNPQNGRLVVHACSFLQGCSY